MSDMMFELADRLRELREAKDTTEQELKRLNAEIDEVDYQLSERQRDILLAGGLLDYTRESQK